MSSASTDYSASSASEDATDSASASSTASAADTAATDAATAPGVSPPLSQSSGAPAQAQPVSLSVVEALLKLRKNSLEALSEDQLPDELRADSIKTLLGRVAANMMDTGNTGVSA